MVEIHRDKSLAEFTTLKIGGKARIFARAINENDVFEAFKFVDENNLDLFILGGGSNVLIADEGFNGLVLQIALKGILEEKTKFKSGASIDYLEDRVFITAQAGEDWDKFVEYCVNKNLQGLECLSGIPGFVGGTPVQNVGAYGQEVSETIVSVRCFDRKRAKIVELTNKQCGFEYRKSIFNTTEKDDFIVLAVTFALILNGQPKVEYADLKNYFGENKPDLPQTRNAVLKIRAKKSMVIDEADPNTKSAGSFFKNPVISKEKYSEICTISPEKVPYYVVDNNNYKIPAAWLIEKSGFYKGYKKGNAGISTTHTLAIINLGNATANEIINLMNEIQQGVRLKFGIEIFPEPIFVGF